MGKQRLEVGDEDMMVVKLVCLFAAATTLSGNTSSAGSVIRLAKKFESYVLDMADEPT